MSTITTINSGDGISGSRTVINTNFSNLNTDKVETSVLDTDTALAANSDSKVPTQKAVKTYIDTVGGANASQTVRGIVEEATVSEMLSGTSTGATGAKLFATPATIKDTSLNPVIRRYLNAASPATWTKPTGLRYIKVKVQAAGGGSGSSGASVGQTSSGAGAGAYSEKLIAAASLGSTETVTIGAKGTKGSGGDGTDGGNSSFGTHVVCVGGAKSTRTSGTESTGGTATTEGDWSMSGQNGGVGDLTSGNFGGMGGSSFMGRGGNISNSSGYVGSGYGAGGGGARRSGAENDGANGTDGIVIVEEYYL